MAAPAQEHLRSTALYLPVADATAARLDVSFPQGATIAEIIALVTPTAPIESRRQLRVVLVTPNAAEVVPFENWHLVRPKRAAQVVIRTVPAGGDIWRSLLMIVVTIAAIALGQIWGVGLGLTGIMGTAATAIITVGVGALGMLLVNALIPPKKTTTDEKQYGGYSISGWKNTSNPDGPIPVPFGRMRMAPYYAAAPYTEIVGDIQYMRAIFVWGYGPLAISDLRFGDTPIDQYDEFEIEHRYGYATDPQLTLVTQQVIEEGLAVDLTRDWVRYPDGSVINISVGGHTVEKPEIRYSASDATEGCVIIGFPAGLYSMNDEGNRGNAGVAIRIRQKLLSGGDWSEVTTLQIVAAKSVPFWRSHRWSYPTRGAYAVEVTRMTDENLSSKVADRTVFQVLQSFRPEYPIAFNKPVALTAIRIKATYQLNGQIDNLSGIVSRIAPDWDAASRTWITRETRSPAAAYRWILQGPALAYPVADAGIDLDMLADWSEMCAAKGLYYDRIHDFEGSLADALGDVTHAGRATPRHDGRKYTLVIDRPSDLVVDHINPRNSRNFRWTRTYAKRPDGFRIQFQDQTNDWKKSERIVPWPGLAGDVTVTEEISFPGKCDPAEIWIEARRRQYETDLRPDTFQVEQDGAARVATRGDLVAVSHDVLARTQIAGRVVGIAGTLVELDEEIEMAAAVDYGIRFRVFDGADDTIGASVVRSVARVVGRSHAVRVTGSGTLPTVDDLVHFGPIASESLLAFVRGEERGEDGAVIFHLVAAAPEIDTLTDAEAAPAWDGRAGTTYTGGGATPAPTVPTITSVQSGTAGTGAADGLVVHVEPGSGSAAIVTRFEIDHRSAGATTWTTKTVTVASGGGSLTGYVWGDEVEIRVRAISLYNVPSVYTPVVSVTIGTADTVVPDVTALSVVRQPSGVRRYSVETGPATTVVVGWRLRGRPGTGWSWSELSPLHTGYLTGSPWETSEPLAAGTYTIGAVAVDSAGTESRNPLLITADLGSSVSAGIMASRIESDLGWTGTVTGGAVVSGELLADLPAPTSLTYRLPLLDFGADIAVMVATDAYAVAGSAVVSMRIGLDADGAPTGASLPLGAATARYIEISITVTHASDRARLGDLVTLVTSV